MWMAGTADEITVEGVLNKHISELTGEDIKMMLEPAERIQESTRRRCETFSQKAVFMGEKMAKAVSSQDYQKISLFRTPKRRIRLCHPRFQDTRKTYEYTFYNARYDER